MAEKNLGYEGLVADLVESGYFSQEDLTGLWGLIDDREREILIRYYGLDCEPLSLVQIAEKLKISKTYVRDLKRKAFRSFRRFLRQRQAINSPWGKTVLVEQNQHEARAKHLLYQAGYRRVDNPFKPLVELKLSKRTTKRLELFGVHCLFDLAICSEQDLRQIYGFGPKCLAEVKECLQQHHLGFIKLVSQ